MLAFTVVGLNNRQSPSYTPYFLKQISTGLSTQLNWMLRKNASWEDLKRHHSNDHWFNIWEKQVDKVFTVKSELTTSFHDPMLQSQIKIQSSWLNEQEIISLWYIEPLDNSLKKEHLQNPFMEGLKQQQSVSYFSHHPAVLKGNFKLAVEVSAELIAECLNIDRVGIWMINYKEYKMESIDLYIQSKGVHELQSDIFLDDYPNYASALALDYPIIANQIAEDPRNQELAEQYFNPLGITSTLHTLIKVRGLIIGVVSCEHVGSARKWRNDEVHFAKEIVEHLSHCLTNQEQKRAEKALQERNERLRQLNEELKVAMQKANQANQAKSNFLANISHEIRTPMNGILGLTELALNTGLSPLQQNYLQHVYDSAESLLEIINDLLDFSKIEAGKLPIETNTFQLSKLLQDVIMSISSKAYQKGLELYVHQDPQITDHLIGDQGRIKQILLNFLSNAVKFTHKGFIKLKITKTEAGLIRFDVIDSGIGIPFHKQLHIFDAFAQADTSISRYYGGTGLGLSIAKQLAELMQGYLELSSVENEGSCFSLFLPLKIVDKITTIPVINQHILVASPLKKEGMYLLKVLKYWGYDAYWVDTFSAIEQALSEKNWDKILLDFHFFSSISKLKNLPLSCILLYHEDWQSNQKLLESQSYLLKPILLESLKQGLKKIGMPKNQEVVIAQNSKNTTLEKLTILIAEDNKVNAMLLKQILKQMGVQKILLAKNGIEAIEFFEGEQPQFIFMDVQMPGKDGIQATEEIRRFEKANKLTPVPIVALTANAMKGDREQCLMAGMNDYISKPFLKKQINEIIKKFIFS